MAASAGRWTEAEVAAIVACLDRVLNSPVFAQAKRQQRFLRYVVTETLAGRAQQLKGYAIGVEVFDRSASFDPATDAIVRVEAARLRRKLRDYYDGEGRTDPVHFDVPKGAYEVRIARREQEAWQATPSSPEAAPAPTAAAAHEAGVFGAGPLRLRPIEDKPSLAVLPFANMSADSAQEYFADGITEDLITELSRVRGLFVISRHSSFVYKRLSKRAEEIGAELGVRYLLEGSVQRSGSRVRITAQLADVATGGHVWAERYDRELKDVFAVQDDVTRRIAAVLEVKLAASESPRGRGGTVSVEAHDLLLRGLASFWVYTQESAEGARELFARAVALDPGYASGHAWLGRALVFQWNQLWDPGDEVLERAFEHARTAVELGPQLPLSHAVLCWVQLWRKQAEASFAAGRRAVALDPNNADAHLFLSLALSAGGYGEEALALIEKGMRLNPHPSALYLYALGQCCFVLKEYDRASAALRRGIELRAAFLPNHLLLCGIHSRLGREGEARAEREAILALAHGRKPAYRSIWLDEQEALSDVEFQRSLGLLP